MIASLRHSEAARRPRRRPTAGRLLTGGLLLGLLLGLAALPWIAERWFRVPATPSAPAGLYLLQRRPPERGDWVVACLPVAVGQHGRERGYLGAGRCPGGTSEVLKRVAALPGDRVTVADEGLRVNGQLLPRTARRRIDSARRDIRAIAPGVYRTRPGEVWLVSNHVPRSWDSRYYGPVPLAGVTAVARRLLPTPEDGEAGF